MRRSEPWPAGVPCWADLSVPDVPAARRFYAAVLGWDFAEPAEPDEFGGYVIAEVDGAAAAGVGPMPQPDAPLAWTLYLASDDADATAAAVTAAGGAVLLPPGDVGPLGRMLIAADPTGAVFGVWQAGEHVGAGITDEPGGLVWEDLRSTDPTAARAFYSAVFGYRTRQLAGGGPDYTTFSLDDERPLGGMGGPTDGAGAPSHWLVYFAVEELEGTIAAVEEHGGKALFTQPDTPYGPMAGIADPFGATFCVIQPAFTPPAPAW